MAKVPEKLTTGFTGKGPDPDPESFDNKLENAPKRLIKGIEELRAKRRAAAGLDDPNRRGTPGLDDIK